MCATTPSSGRIVAVDVLRGLTMAAMIVVNNPGTWSHMYGPLRHAAWAETLTPADLIFPTFLFLVGVSVPLAVDRRLEAGTSRATVLRGAVRRATGLFAIGLGLNLFPDFDLATLRLPGVLQRIAVVYLACVLVHLAWGTRGRVAVLVTILTGYTALLTLVPVPGAGRPLLTPDLSLPLWLDETLLGAHTWRGPGDPEGVLSTLPAVASGLLGLLTGTWLRGRPSARPAALRLAAAGALCLAAGWAWSQGHPAVKELWTGSYVLVTGGWALMALAGCLLLVDGREKWRGLAPLTALGRWALTAYVAAHLISDLTIRVIRWSDGSGGTMSLHHWIQRHLLASWLPPAAASLVQSLLLLALIVAALSVRQRRRA